VKDDNVCPFEVIQGAVRVVALFATLQLESFHDVNLPIYKRETD
jgi:hypothetical protein